MEKPRKFGAFVFEVGSNTFYFANKLVYRSGLQTEALKWQQLMYTICCHPPSFLHPTNSQARGPRILQDLVNTRFLARFVLFCFLSSVYIPACSIGRAPNLAKQNSNVLFFRDLKIAGIRLYGSLEDRVKSPDSESKHFSLEGKSWSAEFIDFFFLYEQKDISGRKKNILKIEPKISHSRMT